MLKFKTKLLLTMFFGMVISTVIMGTALAGASVSGSSQVYPGRTYTYTITVTENASSIFGSATSGGVLGSQTKTWNKDSSTGLNQTITATTSITVTIPSSAAIGSTGTISVSGQGSRFDEATSTVSAFSISGSKTITVVTPPTPPPPTAWELAVREIKKIEEGGSIVIEMNPDDSKEINVPITAFKAAKEGKVIVTIDYGSFKCTIDGSEMGEIPSGVSEVNVGVTLKPAARTEDMLVFDLNYSSTLFYVATYALQPFVDPQEDLIYVYRNYENLNVLEYVNGANLDEDGNVLIRVFASGSYIVSAVSISGSEGNIDQETFIELFATPTPEPTPVPTPTPTPTAVPTPTIEPKDKVMEGSPAVWVLLSTLGVLSVGLAVTVILAKKKNKK